MPGSRPQPDLVTSSTATLAVGFCAFNISKSALTRSLRALCVGPWFAPAELAATTARRRTTAAACRSSGRGNRRQRERQAAMAFLCQTEQFHLEFKRHTSDLLPEPP